MAKDTTLTDTQQAVLDAMIAAGCSERYVTSDEILGAMSEADRPSRIHVVLTRLSRKMPGRILSRRNRGYRILAEGEGS